MVKDIFKPPSKEYTLANWLVDRIQNDPHFEKLSSSSQCGPECSNLVNDFNGYAETDKGNDVTLIIRRLSDSVTAIEKITDISSLVSYIGFIKEIVKEMDEVQQHIDLLGVAIQSAHDAFTLHKTSFLIDSMTSLLVDMEKAGAKRTFSEMLSSQSSLTQKKERKLLAEELKELKHACEEIRGLIGSPETMPKGLIITLVMHLSQAISQIKSTEIKAPQTKQFLKLLENELKTIRNYFPDLAEAGENLQSAIETTSILTK